MRINHFNYNAHESKTVVLFPSDAVVNFDGGTGAVPDAAAASFETSSETSSSCRSVVRRSFALPFEQMHICQKGHACTIPAVLIYFG